MRRGVPSIRRLSPPWPSSSPSPQTTRFSRVHKRYFQVQGYLHKRGQDNDHQKTRYSQKHHTSYTIHHTSSHSIQHLTACTARMQRSRLSRTQHTGTLRQTTQRDLLPSAPRNVAPQYRIDAKPLNRPSTQISALLHY